MKVTILGVQIDSVTTKTALKAVAGFLLEPHGHAVFTPNPEMLVLARQRPQFRSVLNSADLAIPDGVGLLWAARVQGKKLTERVTGTDMVERVCELAAQHGATVFLLGGGRGVAERAASELVKRYPKLKIVGATTGGDVVKDEQGVPVLTSSVQEMLLAANPTILFVGFGHGKQEEWIHTHLHEFPFIRVAMGIGGAFDFIAGDIKRAPGWLRTIQLEWLWRLILQPCRIKRILTAVIVFPCLVIGERLGIIKAE